MAGGFQSGLGAGLQDFIRTFTQLKQFDQEKQRQAMLDAQNTESHQANLASTRMQQEKMQREVEDAPRKLALDKVASIRELLGDEGLFNSPDALAQMKTAGVDVPTKQIPLPSAPITQGLQKGPLSTVPEMASKMGVAPDTGAVLPAQVRAKASERAAAQAKADAVAEFLKGAGGPMPDNPTPRDRGIADLSGLNPNQMWGAPRRSAQEIKDETSARREAEFPFQKLLLETAAANRAPANPAPTFMFDPITNQPRAFQVAGGQATEVKFPPNLTKTAPPRMSPAVAEKIAGSESALRILDKLGKLLPTVQHQMGPAAGRFANLKQTTPGVGVDKNWAAFTSETATLRNAVVKAITGAQMSEPEAKRILKQVPQETDKPEVWLENVKASKDNIIFMTKRIKTLYGVNEGTPGVAAPGAPKTVGRFEIIEK
jgi:hypothetical protein